MYLSIEIFYGLRKQLSLIDTRRAWKYVEVWWAKAIFFPIRRRIKKKEQFYVSIHVQEQIMKLLTRCLLYIQTGLHTTCNIKPFRKNKLPGGWYKGVFFSLQPSHSSPSRVWSFRANLEMVAPPPPPFPQTCWNGPPRSLLFKRPTWNQNPLEQ